MAYLLSIVGPTAVGKTGLSIQLAKTYQTEILSCDSRQIYQELNIGTAKPSVEEREGITHHLMDTLDLDKPYSAGQFEQDAQQILKNLFAKHQLVIATGGSTLYFHALWEGMNDMPAISPKIRAELNDAFEQKGLQPLLDELKTCDPIIYEKIDQKNPARIIRALEVYRETGTPLSDYQSHVTKRDIPYMHLKLGLNREREQLYNRINARVDHMLDQGFEEEVRQLLDKGYTLDLQALRSIGYKEMIPYIQGQIDKEEAIRLIKRNSRRYAKRQLTFFKRYKDLHWAEAEDYEGIMKWVENRVKSKRAS